MNVENLKKLALFLWDLPEEDATKRFDMEDFNSRHGHPSDLVADKHICETASCAIGWGPTAGIMPTVADRFWNDYSDNHFQRCGTLEWYWMFSSGWSEIDNTPKGAAKRILWLLEKSEVPEVYKQVAKPYYIHTNGYSYEDYGDEATEFKKQSVELYKDWIPDAIQSRESLRQPVLDQVQPSEGGDISQQNPS